MNKRTHALIELAKSTPGIDNGRIRMSALIEYKGKTISTGVNSYKTHPIMLSAKYRMGQHFLHAEAQAIVRAKKLLTAEQLQESTLYVLRIKKPHANSTDLILGLAKPCPGCTALIAEHNIKRVYYTLDEDSTRPEHNYSYSPFEIYV